MATTRVISVTEELNLLLKQEDNASALITKLLNEHFNKTKVMLEVQTDVFSVMEQSVKEITKEKQTESLRNAILEEIAKQDEEEKLNNIFEQYENR